MGESPKESERVYSDLRGGQRDWSLTLMYLPCNKTVKKDFFLKQKRVIFTLSNY
jgi:hypothetical protein